MNSTGVKPSGPLLLFRFNDWHISRISSSVKLILSRTVLESSSGGSEYVTIQCTQKGKTSKIILLLMDPYRRSHFCTSVYLVSLTLSSSAFVSICSIKCKIFGWDTVYFFRAVCKRSIRFEVDWLIHGGKDALCLVSRNTLFNKRG